MEANRRLLEANLDACNRMIRVVVNAVRKRCCAHALYDGRRDAGPIHPGGTGIALTLGADA